MATDISSFLPINMLQKNPLQMNSASPSPAQEKIQKFNAMDLEKQADLNMKLFLTYLKNQTPDDKVDTQQMMNTMLTLMGASQQLAANQYLKDIQETLKTQQNQNAIHYLGKEALMENNTLQYDGNNDVSFLTSFPTMPQKAQALIVNEDGELMQKVPLQLISEEQEVVWNGKDRFDQKAPSGTYYITIQATDSAGEDIKSSCKTRLTIDGIQNDQDKTTLLSQGIPIDVNQVKQIYLKERYKDRIA